MFHLFPKSPGSDIESPDTRRKARGGKKSPVSRIRALVRDIVDKRRTSFREALAPTQIISDLGNVARGFGGPSSADFRAHRARAAGSDVPGRADVVEDALPVPGIPGGADLSPMQNKKMSEVSPFLLGSDSHQLAFHFHGILCLGDA